MIEIISLRSENSKTFGLGNGECRLESYTGAIHFKDNYTDPTEAWKDIDLTWVGNQILKAPYELTLDGNKLTFKNKKTGETSTIELLSAIPAGIPFEIIPFPEGVHFQHILSSDKVPFEAQFRVTGKAPITRAFDNEGGLELETSLVNGILTEKLLQIKDRLTRQVRPAKGSIRVDPTLTVQPAGKDAWLAQDAPTSNYGSDVDHIVSDRLNLRYRAIAEFDISGLPAGATLDSATLSLYYASQAAWTDPVGKTVWAYKLTRTDWVELEATYNIYKTANNWTTAGGDFVTSSPAGGSTTFPASYGWMNWNVLAIVQDAYDTSVAAEFLNKFDTEALASGYSLARWHSSNYTTDTTLRPKLVIVYTASVTVTPGTLALATTLYTPSVILGTVVTPGTLALITTLYTPVVTASDNKTVTPGTLALVTTLYTPTVSYAQTVTPGTASLILTRYIPNVFLGTYKIEVDWNNDGDFNDANEDITSNTKTIHYSRGKSDELGKAEVGQLSIILNNDTGLYSPSNSSGALYGNLKPKRLIRVRAYQSGTIYNLFYGFIEEIIPHPHLTEQDCIITAVDGLDFLSRHDLATTLYKNALTGTIHGYILDDASWSATTRTLDAGQDTVPYWYGHDIKARFAQEEIDDSEQGFSYVDGAGYFNFEGRHHRSTATHQTSQATFSNTMAYITYSLNPKNIYNQIKVKVTPWAIQSIAELWRLEETPSIDVGDTLTWWGEASVSGESVFVDAWTTPVSTTDYTANSQSGGGGTDMTSNIAIVTTKFAKTIKLAITNNGTVPAFITLLKARGTYYDDKTKVTRKAQDSTSQTDYQKRTLEIDGKYMTDADLAQDLASYTVGKYKEPRGEISMTLQNQDNATLTQILAREISDRITVVNTKLGVNADFFVDYMEHDISLSGLWHIVTYQLADTINEDFWCLDFSALATNTTSGQTKLGY